MWLGLTLAPTWTGLIIPDSMNRVKLWHFIQSKEASVKPHDKQTGGFVHGDTCDPSMVFRKQVSMGKGGMGGMDGFLLKAIDVKVCSTENNTKFSLLGSFVPVANVHCFLSFLCWFLQDYIKETET